MNIGQGVFLACASVLIAFSTALAHADQTSQPLATSVKIYGNLDVAARYSSNANSQGQSAIQMVSGGLTPSLAGVNGTADLGQGLSGVFDLEAGMSVNDGQLQQQNPGNGTLFGRQAYVGLSGDLGTLTVGRQYNALNAAYVFNPHGIIYWSDPFYLGGDHFLMGYRNNNMVVYSKSFGHLSTQLDYAIGGQAGNASNNSIFGANLIYQNGDLSLAGAFEQAKSQDGQVITRDANIGGAYSIGNTKLYAGYLRNMESGSYSNTRQLFLVGLSRPLTTAVSLSAALYHYKQSGCSGNCGAISDPIQGVSNGGGAGSANSAAFVLQYALPNKVDLYAEADVTHANGGAAIDTAYYYGAKADKPLIGVMVGIKRSF